MPLFGLIGEACEERHVSFSDILTFVEPPPPRTPVPRSMAGWAARDAAFGGTPRERAAIGGTPRTAQPKPVKRRARTPRAPAEPPPIEEDEPSPPERPSSPECVVGAPSMGGMEPVAVGASAAAAAATGEATPPGQEEETSVATGAGGSPQGSPVADKARPLHRPHSHRAKKGATPRARTARTPRVKVGSPTLGFQKAAATASAAASSSAYESALRPPSPAAYAPASSGYGFAGTKSFTSEAWITSGRSASARYGYEMYGKGAPLGSASRSYDLSSPELLC